MKTQKYSILGLGLILALMPIFSLADEQVDGDLFVTGNVGVGVASTNGYKLYAQGDDRNVGRLVSTDLTNSYGILDLLRDSVADAGDELFRLRFLGKNSQSRDQHYASIQGLVLDPRSGDEKGQLQFFVQSDDSEQMVASMGPGRNSGRYVYKDDGGAYGILDLYHASSSPAAMDELFRLRFLGNDVVGREQHYASIQGLVIEADASTGALGGQLQFIVQDSDSERIVAEMGPGRDVARFMYKDNGGAYGIFDLFRDSSSPTATDELFRLRFMGKDSEGQKEHYASIQGLIADANDNSESGKLQFIVQNNHSENVAATILSDGNFGIGVTDPSAKLEVAGDILVNGDAQANSYNCNSSRELKKDIASLQEQDYAKVLEAINKLEVVRYRYKTDSGEDKLHIGLIAEDSPKDILSQDGKSVSLYDSVGYLLASTKALIQRDQRLNRENEDLNQKIAQLEKRLEKLER